MFWNNTKNGGLVAVAVAPSFAKCEPANEQRNDGQNKTKKTEQKKWTIFISNEHEIQAEKNNANETRTEILSIADDCMNNRAGYGTGTGGLSTSMGLVSFC